MLCAVKKVNGNILYFDGLMEEISGAENRPELISMT
jgi:hypothetical protein